MPPRSQPKIYQVQLKTHKLAIFLTLPPSTTIASIKEEALSALLSDVNVVDGVPKVVAVDEFEICRATKDKGRNTGEYEVLPVAKQLKDLSLPGWEVCYMQFRDPSSGELLPVTFTQPTLDDEDEEASMPPSEPEYPASTSKGKRKAHPD